LYGFPLPLSLDVLFFLSSLLLEEKKKIFTKPIAPLVWFEFLFFKKKKRTG